MTNTQQELIPEEVVHKTAYRENNIPKKSFTYYPQLDAFRAIACLAVVLFHTNTVTSLTEKNSFTLFKGGFIGVDMFFVLSGYLITSILIKEFTATSTIAIKKFYFKRVLRLYPPILVAVLIFLVPFCL